MRNPNPLLSTLLVSFNTRTLLTPCLDALAAASKSFQPSPIFIVDNASKDGSAEFIEQHYPDVKLLKMGTNVGFGRANNAVLPEIQSKYLLLLNTDAFIPPDALDKTIAYMESHPRCGILGVRLIGREGDLQPSCRFFPSPFNTFLLRTGLARFFPGTRMVDDMSWSHDSVRECDWVPGCFYLLRHEMLDEIGLFDPRFFLYFEEVDHCFSAKLANWQVVYYPDVSVVHIGGESAKSIGAISAKGRQIEVLLIESALLYFRKRFGFFGLLQYVILEQIADGLLAFKSLFKRKSGATSYHLGRMRHILLSLVQTRLGTKATR
jgi:N-acetylglucosaminyl-diphospho-decaprenol L-rhamnosyltransferase